MKRLAFLSVLSLALVACGAAEPGAMTDATGALAAESEPELKTAPEFDLASFAGGTINSEDLKGKVLVVDFWATWCKPCIEEIPNFNALDEEQSDDRVVMLGITVESGSYEDVEPYITEFGIEYPVVMGNEEVVTGFGGLIGFPTTIVVSPDWKIYEKYLGAKVDKKEQIEQDILELIGPPTVETIS